MAENTINLLDIKRGSLNKETVLPRQPFFVTDTDDSLSIGDQLNKLVTVPDYTSLTGIVYFVDQIDNDTESLFPFLDLFSPDTSPKAATAYVYIDVIHDLLAKSITPENFRQYLTKVSLTGEAANITANSIIEVSFTDGVYSTGKFVRDVTAQTTDARANSDTSNRDKYCNKPSAVPKTPAPSGNTPTPPTKEGTIPEVLKKAAEKVVETVKEKVGVAKQPCDDVQNYQVLKSQVPGVPYEDVFVRNKASLRTRKKTTCFVIHISASGADKKGTIRILNKKNKGNGLNTHFIVDRDGSVSQHTPLEKRSIAQGLLNGQCISIEVLNGSSFGPPSKKYKPGSLAQMEALYQLLLKLQKLVKLPTGEKIPITAMESTKDGKKFLFGVLPFGVDKKKNGIVAHGSARQVNKPIDKQTKEERKKQHSDGRFEVCYCHIRALGSSPQDAYNATLKMTAAAQTTKQNPTPILRK